MTLEDLLECSADKLEALSEKELDEYFSPYYTVTRPDLSKEYKPTIVKSNKMEEMQLNMKLAKARAIAKSFGIELK